MFDIGSARRGPGNTGAVGSGLPCSISANGCTSSSAASAAADSRQWNAMFPGGFHASRWYRPNLCVEINLAPGRPQRFPSACSGKDREFERTCRHARPAPQLGKELRNLVKR
jgi:hypothetical protein